MSFQFALRARAVLLAASMLTLFGMAAPIADGAMRSAHAQEELTGEFRETLAAYGQWIDHPRWGAVWIPAGMPDGWRPYSTGHWVYTDEWGWYWVADEEWGWIPYHYGRWIHDREFGWGWIPGQEWSPAWVSWRRSDDAVGWAPMPPDDVIVEVEESPDYWSFCPPAAIVAPSIAVVLFPPERTVVFVHDTVLISETVVVREGGRVVVANPGVPPSFIAARAGHPIQAVSVQPHVVRGTVGVSGALVGPPPKGPGGHEVIRQAGLIQPAAHVPPPTPFKHGEPPRIGPEGPKVLQAVGTPSGREVTPPKGPGVIGTPPKGPGTPVTTPPKGTTSGAPPKGPVKPLTSTTPTGTPSTPPSGTPPKGPKEIRRTTVTPPKPPPPKPVQPKPEIHAVRPSAPPKPPPPRPVAHPQAQVVHPAPAKPPPKKCVTVNGKQECK